MTTLSPAKDQTITLLALFIIYAGVYTLTSNDVPAEHATDARWAGFFAITLGVFALLSMLFGNSVSSLRGVNGGYNVFSILSLGALLASAFFNFKLVKDARKSSTLQYILYAQIAAHVILLFSIFRGLSAANTRSEGFRAGTAYGVGVAQGASTPGGAPPLGLHGMSPRVPVRAR